MKISLVIGATMAEEWLIFVYIEYTDILKWVCWWSMCQNELYRKAWSFENGPNICQWVHGTVLPSFIRKLSWKLCYELSRFLLLGSSNRLFWLKIGFSEVCMLGPVRPNDRISYSSCSMARLAHGINHLDREQTSLSMPLKELLVHENDAVNSKDSKLEPSRIKSMRHTRITNPFEQACLSCCFPWLLFQARLRCNISDRATPHCLLDVV